MRKRIIACVCFWMISFSFFGRCFTLDAREAGAMGLCLAMSFFFGLLGLIYAVFACCAQFFDNA